MDQISKKKHTTRKKITKVIRPLPNEKVCKKDHIKLTLFKMEEDDISFKQDKIKVMKCEECARILFPINKTPVYLYRDASCNLGLCYKWYQFTINNN